MMFSERPVSVSIEKINYFYLYKIVNLAEYLIFENEKDICILPYHPDFMFKRDH